MITFATQEDFELAVKQIIEDSLTIETTSAGWGGDPTIRLRLDGSSISEDNIPLPTLKY